MKDLFDRFIEKKAKVRPEDNPEGKEYPGFWRQGTAQGLGYVAGMLPGVGISLLGAHKNSIGMGLAGSLAQTAGGIVGSHYALKGYRDKHGLEPLTTGQNVGRQLTGGLTQLWDKEKPKQAEKEKEKCETKAQEKKEDMKEKKTEKKAGRYNEEGYRSPGMGLFTGGVLGGLGTSLLTSDPKLIAIGGMGGAALLAGSRMWQNNNLDKNKRLDKQLAAQRAIAEMYAQAQTKKAGAKELLSKGLALAQKNPEVTGAIAGGTGGAIGGGTGESGSVGKAIAGGVGGAIGGGLAGHKPFMDKTTAVVGKGVEKVKSVFK